MYTSTLDLLAVGELTDDEDGAVTLWISGALILGPKIFGLSNWLVTFSNLTSPRPVLYFYWSALCPVGKSGFEPAITPWVLAESPDNGDGCLP